jgi:hypothetical protein
LASFLLFSWNQEFTERCIKLLVKCQETHTNLERCLHAQHLFISAHSNLNTSAGLLGAWAVSYSPPPVRSPKCHGFRRQLFRLNWHSDMNEYFVVFCTLSSLDFCWVTPSMQESLTSHRRSQNDSSASRRLIANDRPASPMNLTTVYGARLMVTLLKRHFWGRSLLLYAHPRSPWNL